MTSLATLFQEGESPELEALLQHLYAAGCDAWHTVPLLAERFASHLRQHCQPGADPLSVLPSLYIEDLFLACACARGSRQRWMR